MLVRIKKKFVCCFAYVNTAVVLLSLPVTRLHHVHHTLIDRNFTVSIIAQNSKMMIPLLILLLLTLHHVQCVDRVIEKRLNRLAFGSCNKVHSNVSDEIWKSIETFEPEMFAYVIVF